MRFPGIRDIDLSTARPSARPDLETDGSFIAFDLLGDVDTTGLLAESFVGFTLFKFSNGGVCLLIRCKYSPKPGARCHTIEIRGVCTVEESAAMDRLYGQSSAA